MSTLDLDSRYTVKGWPGVAVWIKGKEQRFYPLTYLATDPETGEEFEASDLHGEGEWCDDPDSSRVVVVMVGDDREHMVDESDLTPIEDGDYCSQCGQVGCQHG